MKGHHFTKDLNTIFTSVSEFELEELSDQEAETFSALTEELNMEIDHSAVFGVAEVHEVLSHKLKPLMADVLTEAYNILHLSEHPRPTALKAVGEAETGYQDAVQNYPISPPQILRLSEGDAAKMQLADREQMKELTELQKELHASEDMVQSLQLQLSSSQHSVQLLKDELYRSKDCVHALKKQLKEKDKRIQLLKKRLLGAQASKTFIQDDLSRELSHRLQQQLNATEEQNRELQEALRACEVQVQEAKKENERSIKSKEECQRTIRDMQNVFKGLNNQLESTLDDLHGELKMALEREESLKMTIEKLKVRNMVEVEQLQQNIDQAKQEAKEMEKQHHMEIMRLHIKLLDEHTFLTRELKSSMKYETVLEEMVTNLRRRLSSSQRNNESLRDHQTEADLNQASERMNPGTNKGIEESRQVGAERPTRIPHEPIDSPIR